jgi:hypothetical protein
VIAGWVSRCKGAEATEQIANGTFTQSQNRSEGENYESSMSWASEGGLERIEDGTRPLGHLLVNSIELTSG